MIARTLLIAETRATARSWLRIAASDRCHPAHAKKLRADAADALDLAQRLEDGEEMSDELVAEVLAGEAEAARDERADDAAFFADCGAGR